MALTLKAMQYFTTALRRGNIAQAAAELNIAASAVAAAIDQVESEFDLSLVTRQRARGIRATASGLTVARKCERLLDDYRAILAEGTELKGSLGGSLRIGYYAPVAPGFLPTILSSMQADDMQLHLDECDNDDAQQGLLAGRFDVILFVSDGVRPSIDFDVLIEAPPYCLVRAGHPLAGRPHVSMARLARESMVVLDRPLATAYYRSLFDVSGREMSIAASATSTEMVRSLVGAGHGCAILNMRPATSTSYAGATLVELPIVDRLPPLNLAVGYDKVRPRRLVQRFVDACRDYFAGADADRHVVTARRRSQRAPR